MLEREREAAQSAESTQRGGERGGERGGWMEEKRGGNETNKSREMEEGKQGDGVKLEEKVQDDM